MPLYGKDRIQLSTVCGKSQHCINCAGKIQQRDAAFMESVAANWQMANFDKDF